MKKLGILLILVGVALFIFLVYSFLKDQSKLISPIPEEKGVKVIFVTPTK